MRLTNATWRQSPQPPRWSSLRSSISLAALLALGACAHGIGDGSEGIGGEAGDVDAGNKADDPDQGPDAAPIVTCTAGSANFEDPNTGVCYMLFDNQQNWDAARVACEALGPGSHLATVADANENQAVLNLAMNNDVWIAGTDAGNEGNWIWYQNDPFSFQNWRSGEPNNGSGNEDCMVLEGMRGGTWDDRSCGESRRFVCERAP